MLILLIHMYKQTWGKYWLIHHKMNPIKWCRIIVSVHFKLYIYMNIGKQIKCILHNYGRHGAVVTLSLGMWEVAGLSPSPARGDSEDQNAQAMVHRPWF